MSDVGKTEESLATRYARRTQTGKTDWKTDSDISCGRLSPQKQCPRQRRNHFQTGNPITDHNNPIIDSPIHWPKAMTSFSPASVGRRKFEVRVSLCRSVAKNVFFFPVKIDK